MDSTTPLLIESGGGSGPTPHYHHHDNDNDNALAILLSEEYLHDYAERLQVMHAEDSSCCWRIVKSIIVLLLSLTSILASIYVILNLAKQQPSSSFDIKNVMAFIMASNAIDVSICFVIYTEVRILFGHSMDMKRRKSIHTLSQQMTSLKRKNKLLTRDVEDLEVLVIQYDVTVMKLRYIIAYDDIEQIVNLVKYNEDILHQIRTHIQQQILYDIIKQIVKFPPDNYVDTLDYNSAKQLTTAYHKVWCIS
jgi:hypothetical protein